MSLELETLLRNVIMLFALDSRKLPRRKCR